MKQLQQHWSARPLSWLLSVAMTLPALLFLLFAGAPASAQDLTPSGMKTWAVLNFENHSGYGGPEIGRIGSDAFVVELSKSGKYNVLSRQETQQGIANAGLTTPLDTIGIQKLAAELQTDAVATGEVAAISFSNNPRQATASLVIRVTDKSSGELINGALAQGTSNARAVNTNDDEALVNEAINNAAFAAVRQITQFNLPTATILNNEDATHVLVNKGTSDGLYNGLNMVVSRHGSEVGRIQIANASADESDAVVTRRGLGIQPGDISTAIYSLPSYTATPGQPLKANPQDINSDGPNRGAPKHSVFSGVTGLLLSVLAGVLLLSFIRSGNASGSLGGAKVGKPVAVEGLAQGNANSQAIGGSGTSPGLNASGAAFASLLGEPSVLPANYIPISIKVTATNGNVPTQSFIEYHVYRSTFPPILNDGSGLLLLTGVTNSGGGNNGGTNNGTVSNFGQIPVLVYVGAGYMQVFDDGGDKPSITASKPTLPVTGGNNGGTNNSGGNNGNSNSGGNGLQQVSFADAAGIPGTGIPQVGDRFFYYIEGLYSQLTISNSTNNSNNNNSNNGNTNNTNNSGGTNNSNNSGGQSQTTNYYLTGRSATNYVTYLEPVEFNEDITGGWFATSTSPDNVIVTVPSSRSADDYVLDLSADPAFKSGVHRLAPDSSGPYNATASNPRNGNPVSWYLQTGSKSGSLRQLFPNATQVFARIGCRDSRNGSDQGSNPYIFTDTASVPSNLVPASGGVGGPPAAPSARAHHSGRTHR